MNDSVTFEAIGVIRTPFRRAPGTPIQPSRSAGSPGRVEVYERFRDGLRDLDGFERIWLIYWLDRAPPAELAVVPFLDTEPRGVFATRAPARPNQIGISAVRRLRIDGCKIEFEGADMLDNTPLLDIKPYVSEFDAYPGQKAGWLDRASSDRAVADGRFELPEAE
jgi:tRNA-Thr(GGU) m(6)t(6)A37 methyltransferase TsaA